jgi:RHS repeat-associated protein
MRLSKSTLHHLGLSLLLILAVSLPALAKDQGEPPPGSSDPAAQFFPELAPLPSENDSAADTPLASPEQQNLSSGLQPESNGAIAPEALSALAASGPDDGQPDETLPGFTSSNAFHAKGIDNVNVFSGDPGIAIPLPSYVLSPGLSWGLTAYNTSKFWHFDTSTTCLDNSGAKVRHANIHGYPTLGVGWTLDPGYYGVPIAGAGPYHRPDGGAPRGLELARLRITPSSTNANCSASPCTTIEFPDGSTQIFDHAYTRAHPTNTTSHDFTDENKWLDNTTRYGLTKIVDRFGKVVVRVNYDPTFPDEFTSFVLYADQSVTITVTWQTLPAIADANNGNPAWRTIQKIDFPATGAQTLSVAFTYDTTHGGMARNSYDTSAGNAQCGNPATTAVPYLTKIDFKNGSGTILSTYQSAPCFDLTNCNNSDFFGSVAKLTLPTGGALSYLYGLTNDSCTGTLTDCTDPEIGVRQPGLAPVQAAAVPQTAVDFEKFEDSSAAVYERDELDASGNILSTIKYNRYDYIPWNSAIPTSQPFTTKIARQVVVKENSGDGSFYKTKHLFHVAYFASGSQPDDGGREIERRYYDKGAEANVTPIRTIINCLTTGATDGAGTCGYRSSGTNLTDMSLINAYGLSGEIREQRGVTWYGANPTANNGGTCSGTTPRCTGSASTGSWDDTAKNYKTTTTTSTLTGMTGWTSRANTTTYNAQTGTHWILDIFTDKSVTDSGTGLPAPTSVQTNYTFNTTNRYLQSSSTSDATYGTITRIFSASPDTFGNPTSRTLAGSGLTSGSFADSWSFVKNGLLTSQRTGISWKSFDVTRDGRTGLISASRDPNVTLSTSYSFDALGRLTTITPPGGELATAISFDSPTQTTVTRGSGSTGTWQRFLYDSLGRISREIRQLPSNFSVRFHQYDSGDHEKFISEPATCTSTSTCAAASPTSGTTFSNFDPFSRPRQITRADNTTATINYADGTITHSDSLESVTVNNVGGATSTTVTRKDSLGRVITVTEPSVGGVADVTTYSYNVLDKLGKVTQGAQTRTFTYDAFGFVRSETNPEKGTTTYGPYDALGDLLGKTDGGISYTNSYDAAGRLWTEYAGAVEYAANCYDGTTYVVGVSSGCPESKANFAGGTYHLGKLTRRYGYNPSITANASTDDFTYSDATGRLSSETTTANSGTSLVATQSWTYNSLGLIATHNHPRSSGTFPVTYTYSFGLPTTITANMQTVASSVAYNPAGGLQSWIDGGAVTTTIAPNVIPSRPSSISTSNGAFSSGTYSYDGAGNITAIGGDTFKYDGRSRLVSAFYSGQPTPCTDSLGNLSRGQCFAYDRFGNLTGVSGDNARTLATSTANNHLSSGTYDSRGNMTIFGTETLTWDDINRQVREQSSGVDWKYLYDAANERIARIPASGTTFYTFRDEGSHVATEYAGAALGRDNVFLGNLMVASFVTSSLSGTPGWTYFHSDHLGTPRYLTGAETGNPKYWPYGDEVTVNSTTQKLRFATMERDVESNHYYDHERSHDFNLGRFLTTDKVRGDVGRPHTWNRYLYASDNPIVRYDRNGMADYRTDNDKAILENPRVLITVGEMIQQSRLRGPATRQRESGTIVIRNGDGSLGTTETTVGKTRNRTVTQPAIFNGIVAGTGEHAEARIHTHTAQQYVLDPTDGRFKPTDPSSTKGSKDRENAQAANKPSYVLNSTTSLFNYDAGQNRDVPLLTEQDYQDYMDRATKAFEDFQNDKVDKEECKTSSQEKKCAQ